MSVYAYIGLNVFSAWEDLTFQKKWHGFLYSHLTIDLPPSFPFRTPLTGHQLSDPRSFWAGHSVTGDLFTGAEWEGMLLRGTRAQRPVFKSGSQGASMSEPNCMQIFTSLSPWQCQSTAIFSTEKSSTWNNFLRLNWKFHLFLNLVFIKHLQCARHYGINNSVKRNLWSTRLPHIIGEIHFIPF